MTNNRRSAHLDPATAQGVIFGFLWQVALLTVLAMVIGVTLPACSRQQLATAQTVAVQVPQPSLDASTTIRACVAAKVKALVQAHPETAPWVNGAATVCYEISGVKLPDPTVLKALFGSVEMFAPPKTTLVLDGILDVYTADYPLASSVQGASKNYLTLLGQGIQDGVKAAAVGDAP